MVGHILRIEGLWELTWCALQRIAEHLHFLNHGQVIIVRCHGQHHAVLNVERDFPGVPIFPDKGMKSICVGNPANETCNARLSPFEEENPK